MPKKQKREEEKNGRSTQKRQLYVYTVYYTHIHRQQQANKKNFHNSIMGESTKNELINVLKKVFIFRQNPQILTDA